MTTMGATTRLTTISGGATAGKPPRQSFQRLRSPVVKARIASGRPFREEPTLLSTLRPGPKSKTPLILREAMEKLQNLNP